MQWLRLTTLATTRWLKIKIKYKIHKTIYLITKIFWKIPIYIFKMSTAHQNLKNKLQVRPK